MSKHIQSPVPFWFVNGQITEEHVIREFEMMREKGISELIVHPRYGLQVEYLSDDWFQIFGWCVREAKTRGMFVWIYDEFNWPSGTAGMRVMTIDPEFRGKYISVESLPLHEIDFGSFQPGLYMSAANIEGGLVTKTRPIDGVESLKGLTGNWTIFNCTLNHDGYYIDTLSFAAVNCFKRLTYDEYYRRFGDEFGKTIRAIFTDEPSIYWVSVGYDDCNLPYTNDYFETFEERYGYSPAPMIPYLFHSGREGTAFRADYWEHAGRLFNERYHSNLGDWCREHGIIYTGHNNHEEPLRYQIRYQGDMFGTMRAMDIPGVDHLGKQTLGNNWISIIGHKICSSQAHISGKARCMSESFGVMDWDTTFTSLKRVVDWQYAQGINLLIPHALYHTISGMIKRESPPSFFYQSPHWEDFDYFVDYVKRLEEMLCGGRHLCRVAVLYPTSGLWASYQSDRKTPEFAQTDNFLNSLCLELIKNHIDFDIVDFPAIQSARLENGAICLADESYDYLIVSSSPYLRTTEVMRLKEIVQAEINTTFFFKSMEPGVQNLPDGLRGAGFVRTEELESFVQVLQRQLGHDIEITGGGAEDIMVYRREKEGRKITFVVNRSEKHRKVSALIKDYPDAAMFDHESGNYTALEGKQTGRKTLVQLRFEPNQSYFIVSNVPDARASDEPADEPLPIPLTDLTVSVPFNVASVYHFRYSTSPQPSPKGEGEGKEHSPHRDGVAPSPVGEGWGEVDVRTNPRYSPVNWDPNPPDFTQFAGTYEAEVEINCDPSGIRMVLDSDYAECELFVNGTKVETAHTSPQPFLRPCSGQAPTGEGVTQPATLNSQPFLTDLFDVAGQVQGLLQKGVNRFVVVSPTKLSEPLRFVGNFHVQITGQQVVLNEPGEPNPLNLEVDYPFYSGTMTYRAEFELDRDYSSLVLNLHEPRDAAAVRLNGQLVGKRLWAPYVFELAPVAQMGKNVLEIEVRNNMVNLIQGNPRPMGLRTIPTLAVR